jgi:hypothetical protein
MRKWTIAKLMKLTALVALLLACLVNPVVRLLVWFGSHLFFAVVRLNRIAGHTEGDRPVSRAERLAGVAGNLAISDWLAGIGLLAAGPGYFPPWIPPLYAFFLDSNFAFLIASTLCAFAWIMGEPSGKVRVIGGT